MYVVCVASVTEFPSWTYQMVDKYPLPLSLYRLCVSEPRHACLLQSTVHRSVMRYTQFIQEFVCPVYFSQYTFLVLFVLNQVVWATHQFLTIRVGNIHPQIELCPFVRFKSKPYMGSLVRYL